MKINNTINAGIVDQSGADKEMFNASQINSVPVSKQTLYDNYTLIYDEINEEWNFKLEDDELIETSQLENFLGTENIVTLGTITTGSWNANIIPVEYGGTGNTTGNAASASKLQTSRNIGGVSFDGTANIDLPGVNTTGDQDTTGNAESASKLQTARNIGGVSFDGTTNIDLPGVNTTGDQDTTGNAESASKLQTARNIGGVSFDGTANIDLPGVNTTGDQDTTGNASTASKILSIDNDNIVQLTSEQTVSNKTLTALNGITINSEKEVNIGNNRIQNVSDPIDIQDAATKSYVDTVAEGLHIQESCRLATTENITLSGTQTIDGIVTIEGDRILVKDQQDKTENGVYDVSSEGWTRSSDFDEPNEIKAGDFVFVTDGILNGSHGYVMTQTSEVIVGDTDITWTQFSGAGQIEGGDGISKNGNQLSVDLKSEGGLKIESTKLGLDLGNNSITGVLDIINGGTGVSSLGTTGQILKVNSEENGLVWGSIPNAKSIIKSFEKISITGQDDVVADSSSDTLTLVAGSGMTITSDSSVDTITFSRSGDFEEINVDDINIDGHTIKNDTGDVEIISTNPDIGGIGTGIIKLNDNVRISNGELYVDIDNYNQKINLRGTNHGVGIDKDELIYIRGDSGFKIFKGGSHVKGEYSTGEEIFKIDSDGNVGIGKNPTTKLDVNGDSRIDGTISYGDSNKTASLYIKGTGSNNNANRLVILAGETIVDSDILGLTLTIINGQTLEHVSSTNYDTHNYMGDSSHTSSDNSVYGLAAAINDMTHTQIGILTSYGSFTRYFRDVLRTAVMRVGLTKLAKVGSYFDYDDNYQDDEPYAGIFYGTSSDSNSGTPKYIRDVIEIYRNNEDVDGDYESPPAVISTTLSTDGNYAGIAGASSVNALWSASPEIENPALICDKDGNVGIGTTSPDVNLHIYNTRDSVIKLHKNVSSIGSCILEFHDSTSILGYLGNNNRERDLTLSNLTASNLVFQTDSSDRMIINSSGNVGIGTTSPSAKLHIRSNTTGQNSLLILENNTTNWGGNDDGASIEFRTYETGNEMIRSQAKILVADPTTNDSGDADLVFQTRGDGVVTEKMRILNNGNVGIGTIDPLQKLEVYPDTNNSAVIGRAHIGYMGYNDYAGFSHLDQVGPGSYALKHSYNGDTFLNSSSDRNIYFRSNNDEKMFLSGSTGNLGIGTTNPSAKLHIYNSTVSNKVVEDNVDLLIEHGESRAQLISTNDGSAGSYIALSNAPSSGNQKNWVFHHFGPNQDNKLGIYYKENSSSNTDALYLNSNLGLTLNTSGNVGIGTTNPTTPLHIYSDTSGDTITINNINTGNTGRSSIRFNPDGNNWEIGARNSNSGDLTNKFYLYDINSSSARLIVESSTGNVGIGTINPTEKLEVYPNTDISAIIGRAHIGHMGHDDHAGFSHLDLNGTTGYALLQSSSGNTFLNAALSKNMYFRINNQDKMVLSGSTGNLGIGTNNPNVPLHIVSDPSGDTISIVNTSTVTAGRTSIFFGPSGTYWELGARNSSSGDLANKFYLYDRTHAEARLVVDRTGNVGIGTVNPSANLHVNGNSIFGASINIKTDSDPVINIISYNDDNTASINLYGNSTQGTGRVYVGQDINYGGGFLYDGDTDYATFFRRNNGNDTQVFGYQYDSSDVYFYGNISADNVFSNKINLTSELKLTGDLYFDHTNPFVISDSGGQFVMQAKNSAGLFILRNMNDADLFTFNVNDSVHSFQPVFVAFSASDNFATIGWAFIGYPGHFANAGFGHSNFSTDSKSYAIRQTGSGATVLNSKSGQHLYFRIDDADKMRITSSGDVGIGTTSPNDKLDVSGTVRCQSLFFHNVNYDTVTTGWHIIPGSNDSLPYDLDNLYFRTEINGSPQIVGYIEDGTTTEFRMNDFTGQHRSILNQNIDENSVGLIVSSNGTYINLDNTLHANINESLPTCDITTIDNDIKVFGVISDKEDTKDTRRHESGVFITPVEKTNKNEQRVFVNSVGEGAIWVCSKNGNLENGDYISSSSVPGYGMKQTLDSGTLKNYTVAKITCDCDFSLTKVVKQKLKTVIITETYEEDAYDLIEEEETKIEIVYDEATTRYVQKEVTTTKSVSKQIYDTVDLYDESGEVIGSHQIARKVTKTKESRHIDYDSNGDVQFEDDLDPSGTQQMVFPLETRFLLPDATEITEDEYTSRLEAGDEVYVACFVGCTYHCG